MAKIMYAKSLLKLMGREGVFIMFISFILTIGAINFVWTMLAPVGAAERVILFFVSLIGGISLFVVNVFLMLSVVLPWMINRRIKKFFGPVMKINEEYERRKAEEEKAAPEIKPKAAKKPAKKKGRRINVE